MIKKKEKTGDIIKVPFDGKHFIYAQYLSDGLYSFYDIKVQKDISDLADILKAKKMFSIIVHSSALKKNGWAIVGNMHLPSHDRENPPLFVDKILPHGQKPAYEIYQNGQTRDASKEECIGLEYFFVWSPERVEERIRDYYAGRPNFQAEYYRIKE